MEPSSTAELLAYTERFGSDELVVVESDAPVLGVDTTLRQASRSGAITGAPGPASKSCC